MAGDKWLGKTRPECPRKEDFDHLVFCHTLHLENELQAEIVGARLADLAG